MAVISVTEFVRQSTQTFNGTRIGHKHARFTAFGQRGAKCAGPLSAPPIFRLNPSFVQSVAGEIRDFRAEFTQLLNNKIRRFIKGYFLPPAAPPRGALRSYQASCFSPSSSALRRK